MTTTGNDTDSKSINNPCCLTYDLRYVNCRLLCSFSSWIKNKLLNHGRDLSYFVPRCVSIYITCYLKAAALLLNVLKRQKSQQSTRLLFYIIVFILHWCIPESVIAYLFLYFCGYFIPTCRLHFPH